MYRDRESPGTDAIARGLLSFGVRPRAPFRASVRLPGFTRRLSMTKTTPGNFFEDFRLGQTITHATPRTVTTGDVALYNALFGARFAVQSVRCLRVRDRLPAFAGRRSPRVSYRVRQDRPGHLRGTRSPTSAMRTAASWLRSIRATRSTAVSEVIGLKENSSRKTGVVYVRSAGFRQDGAKVLEYVRWVMVRKRDESAAAPGDLVPQLAQDRRSRHAWRCGAGDRHAPL